MPRRDPLQQPAVQPQLKSNGKGKVRANGKSTRGTISTYNPKYAEIAEVLMRDHGFTEAELAAALRTTVPTLTKWKRETPELLLAIKNGKEHFDVHRVQEALRSRALGYKYDESEEGITSGLHGGPYEKTFHKSMAPDVTACIFWLVNRNPEKWKHLARTIVQGDPKNPVKHQHDGTVKHDIEGMDIVNDPVRAAEVARILKASGAFDTIAGIDTAPTTH